MLADWLGPTSLDAFRAEHLGRAPLARPGTAHAMLPSFDWEVLAHVLATGAADTIVVTRGQGLPMPPPRTLAELDALFAAGVGLAMRHTQRCHPALAAVHAEMEELLGTSQVQLFVTPPGTHGFTWHYDDEDVFIVQTHGTKEYFFRENTVAADERARAPVFQRFHAETSPIMAATLVPGDFLYLPARWWHMAECARGAPALSISVGVFPRA